MIQADIREFAAYLLRLDEEDPPLLAAAPQREVQLFAANKHDGPKATKGFFLLDLLGSCSSPWNKRAGVVFARAFVSSGPGLQVQRREINRGEVQCSLAHY